MLPKRDKEERYLLLPSVFGIAGLLRVFVEADRLKDGIMEVLIFFTLAERANDAFVGVVIALGKPDGVCTLEGVVCRLEFVSRETGLAAEVSSPGFFFARLPGDVFSSLSRGSLGAKDLNDLVR